MRAAIQVVAMLTLISGLQAAIRMRETLAGPREKEPVGAMNPVARGGAAGNAASGGKEEEVVSANEAVISGRWSWGVVMREGNGRLAIIRPDCRTL